MGPTDDAYLIRYNSRAHEQESIFLLNISRRAHSTYNYRETGLSNRYLDHPKYRMVFLFECSCSVFYNGRSGYIWYEEKGRQFIGCVFGRLLFNSGFF